MRTKHWVFIYLASILILVVINFSYIIPSKFSESKIYKLIKNGHVYRRLSWEGRTSGRDIFITPDGEKIFADKYCTIIEQKTNDINEIYILSIGNDIKNSRIFTSAYMARTCRLWEANFKGRTFKIYKYKKIDVIDEGMVGEDYIRSKYQKRE